MFKSIFQRLFFTQLIVMTAIIFVMSLVMTIGVTNYTMQGITKECENSAKLIERWMKEYQIENQSPRLTQIYQEKIKDCAELLECDITIVDFRGEVFDSTNFEVKRIDEEYLKESYQGEVFREMGNFGGMYNDDVFTVGVPLKYNGTELGIIFFNKNMPNVNKVVFSLVLMFIMALVVASAVVVISIYFQAKNISKRLKSIKYAALDIAAGNFPDKLAVTSKDEIGQLCSSFNFMSESLEKLDNMRNRFLSDVSHELRTPMTSIAGFIQGILDGTIPAEKQSEYLKIVYDETTRLTRLVNDMLEMTKMSSSEYKLNISEFDVNELIRLCIISSEQKIDDKGIDLDVDFAEESLMVCADRDAIQRVLINLIDNAIKFSHKGTMVKIASQIINKKANIKIGDIGEPISNDDLSHIFDRFYKTDLSRHGNKSGAGLGLSFVKNIMLLHKQQITVKSIPQNESQNYTEFEFTLELA